jgi:hypothetical protein
VKFILLITKGLIRDAAMRRKIMGGCVLAAFAMVLCGTTFLAGLLSEQPRFFLVFWTACAWVTLLAVLMALYDMLMLRAEARHAQEQLKKKILGDEDERIEKR